MSNESISKMAGVIQILLPGFKQGFWQDLDHKNVHAVLGMYRGFAYRKVEIFSYFPGP